MVQDGLKFRPHTQLLSNFLFELFSLKFSPTHSFLYTHTLSAPNAHKRRVGEEMMRAHIILRSWFFGSKRYFEVKDEITLGIRGKECRK